MICVLSLVYIHNLHPGFKYTPCVNLHRGVFWSCKRCFKKMHPGANLHPGVILLHLSRWSKFSGVNKHPGAHLPLSANCAHERNLLSQMYNLISCFDKLTILLYDPVKSHMKINSKNHPLSNLR